MEQIAPDTTPTVQGKVTGIIYPPPDIRAIVDKTAQFVARNGRSFERKIAGDSASGRFSFLRSTDPYNAYYEHKVTWFTQQHNDASTNESESRQDNVHENESRTPVENSQISNEVVTPEPNAIVVEKKAVEAVTARVVKKIRESTLTPPEEEKFIIKHPQLSALDQEIMYLTAQYTALSGKTFLAGLATREQRNPQFDFLKPTHALFAYFTALVESYAQVLSRGDTQMRSIEEGMDRMKVLDRSVYKLEWMRQEQEKKDREAAESDAERQALSQIDWHDFIVVETITFNEAEEETAALAAASAVTNTEGSDGEDMDVEEDSDDDDKASKPNIKVVQDYVPLSHGAGQSSSSGQQQSLLSVDGKAVSLADANEHMRILLMDPKWREERQRHLEKQKETSYAAGTAISDSLKRFATKRADIFASSTEEAARLKRLRDTPDPASIGEQNHTIEDERDDIIDDEDEIRGELEQSMSEMVDSSSHMVPPDPPAAAAAMGIIPPGMGTIGAPGMIQPHFQQGVTPGVYGFGGMLPPHGMFPPGMAGGMPTPDMNFVMAPGSAPPGFMTGTVGPLDESAQRIDGPPPLLTEVEFAALNPGNVRLSIRIPKDDENAQWNMNGQTITVEIDVKDTMRKLKEKLMSELGNIPINKFQLKAPVGFVKDTLSCAHYNFVNGTTLDLSVRQRGGRR